MVRFPVWLPVANPVGSTLTLMFCGAEPFAGENVSHEESLVAVQLKLPDPPPFVTAIFCAGTACPKIAVKLRVEGDTTSTGGCATTVKFTVMVTVVLTAPSDTMV